MGYSRQASAIGLAQTKNLRQCDELRAYIRVSVCKTAATHLLPHIAMVKVTSHHATQHRNGAHAFPEYLELPRLGQNFDVGSDELIYETIQLKM